MDVDGYVSYTYALQSLWAWKWDKQAHPNLLWWPKTSEVLPFTHSSRQVCQSPGFPCWPQGLPDSAVLHNAVASQQAPGSQLHLSMPLTTGFAKGSSKTSLQLVTTAPKQWEISLSRAPLNQLDHQLNSQLLLSAKYLKHWITEAIFFHGQLIISLFSLFIWKTPSSHLSCYSVQTKFVCWVFFLPLFRRKYKQYCVFRIMIAKVI